MKNSTRHSKIVGAHLASNKHKFDSSQLPRGPTVLRVTCRHQIALAISSGNQKPFLSRLAMRQPFQVAHQAPTGIALQVAQLDIFNMCSVFHRTQLTHRADSAPGRASGAPRRCRTARPASTSGRNASTARSAGARPARPLAHWRPLAVLPLSAACWESRYRISCSATMVETFLMCTLTHLSNLTIMHGDFQEPTLQSPGPHQSADKEMDQHCGRGALRQPLPRM